MNRRDVLVTVGGAAVAWPLVARAQPVALPAIGFLGTASPEGFAPFLAGFRKGLEEGGFREGHEVAIEYRWARNERDRVPVLAAELVALHLSVIVATGGPDAALAVKAATSSTPIVFVSGVDPVEAGIVPTLNRPGANITGVTFFVAALLAKRLELLREALPNGKIFGVALNPTGVEGGTDLREVEALQARLGRSLVIGEASNDAELKAAFEGFSAAHVDGLVFAGDPFFFDRREVTRSYLQHLGLAAISPAPGAGILLSYGPSASDAYRMAGQKVARILNGTKPADLPVEQASKFPLVVNLTVAKALGLTLPPTLLARADEVVE